MSEKTRYVDADLLAQAIRDMPFTYYHNSYSGQLDGAVNTLINQAVTGALYSFKEQLANTLAVAGKPYDKCLLCVQRDSCVPPNLGVGG